MWCNIWKTGLEGKNPHLRKQVTAKLCLIYSTVGSPRRQTGVRQPSSNFSSWDRSQRPGPLQWAPSMLTNAWETQVSPSCQSGLTRGGECAMLGEVGSRRAQRKAKPLATHLGLSFLPSSFLPVAYPCNSSPRYFERSPGSTEYISSSSNLRLWPILNKGFSHLLKIKRKNKVYILIIQIWEKLNF